MSKVKFFALGGQDEKGKNCYILEVNDNIFMIDAGIKNPVVSRLGIDTIIPNFNYIKTHRNNFQGVFISSARDASFAALPWLLKQVDNVKIYSSKFVSKIIQERLTKYQIPPKNYQIIIIDGIKNQIGGINIQTFELAGSIPNTLGFNFQTPQGDVIYMSSFVLNEFVEYCGHTDLNKIKGLISDKGILFLAMESGFSNYHGYSNEKAIIRPLIENNIKDHDTNKRIIIVAYDESMSTIQEILKIAIDYDKSVVIYGKSFSNALKEWKSIYPNMKLPKFLDYQSMYKSKNSIILVTGTGSRLYQRLDRIAMGKDVFLKLKDTDLVMVIAAPINGHEKFASRAEDKVAEITTHLIDIPRDDFYEVKPADQDIMKVIETLKPKYFIPIRGLYYYLSIASQLAKKTGMAGDKTIILNNYKKAIFNENKLESQNEFVKDTAEVIIDGLGIGDISPSVIAEREILAKDGLVIVTIVLERKTHKLKNDIQIQTKGVITANREDEYIQLLKERILVLINSEGTHDANNDKVKWNFRETQNSIKKIARSFSRKQITKAPIIIVNLFEI